MLWFAGASALAGLLNLVPRYLPRYGMAPEWARATRPLVVIFTLITFVVTIAFNADVDAQGGAYATGVLVLISSGAVAVAIMKWQQRHHVLRYGAIAAIFLYTTFVNMAERPEGLKIASIFIADDHLHVAGVARAAIDRASRARRRAGCHGGSLHRRPPRDSAPFESSPTAPTKAIAPSTSTS